MNDRIAERDRLMAEQERLLREGVPIEDLARLVDIGDQSKTEDEAPKVTTAPASEHDQPMTGIYPPGTLWDYDLLKHPGARTTTLALTYEIDGTPMSDDFYVHEAPADDLFRRWLRRYGEKDGGKIGIYWSVRGELGDESNTPFESAPFQDHAWLHEDFLTFFTWPRHADTGDRLNWLRLPVLDESWNEQSATKGGFFQEHTGWKPSPLQATVDIEQILKAIGSAR